MAKLIDNMLSTDIFTIMSGTLSPADTISLITENAESFDLQAIIEMPDKEITGLAQTALISKCPILHINTNEAQAKLGRLPNNKDKVVLNNKKYRIQNPKDDGFGIITMNLLEQTNAPAFIN